MDDKKVLEKMQSVGADMHKKSVNESEKNTGAQETEINLLELFFCEPHVVPYEVGVPIVLYQPTIKDFIECGEDNIYGLIMPFISNSTTYRLQLWKNGVDWNKVSDYEMFLSLFSEEYANEYAQYSHVLFGDLDIRKFERVIDTQGEEPCPALYNYEQKVFIDEKVYKHIATYVQAMFNAKPKVEFAKGKSNKLDCIFEDQQKLKHQKKEENKSNMLNMLSFCLNHPGFKYKKSELKEVGIFEFMDSVQRLNLYEGTKALVSGVYSNPFLDGSKLNKDELNFMRNLNSSS